MVKPVSDLALIYMEPITHEYAVTDGVNHHDDGFAMGFSASVNKVELKPDTVLPLLKEASELYQFDTPPNGCSGCEDCKRLNSLVNLIARSESNGRLV